MKKIVSALMITCMLVPMFAENVVLEHYRLEDDINTVGQPTFGGLVTFMVKSNVPEISPDWFGYSIFNRVLWDAPSEIKGLTNKQAYLFSAIIYKEMLLFYQEEYKNLYNEYNTFRNDRLDALNKLQGLAEQAQTQVDNQSAVYQKEIEAYKQALQEEKAKKKSSSVMDVLIGVCVGIAIGGTAAVLTGASMGK